MAERFIALAQDPGSDGSSTQGKANGSGEDHAGATFLTAPLSANSNTNIGNSNADGVMTPKVYRYVIETGSMTASGTNGTVCSKDSAQFSATHIDDAAKADTCAIPCPISPAPRTPTFKVGANEIFWGLLTPEFNSFS